MLASHTHTCLYTYATLLVSRSIALSVWAVIVSQAILTCRCDLFYMCDGSSLDIDWSIFYRADDASSFLNLKDQAKVDSTFKRKSALQDLKLTLDEIPPIEKSVRAAAQRDHFCKTSVHGAWYSIPVDNDADVTSYQKFFDSVQTMHAGKRRKRALGSEDNMLVDIDSVVCHDKMFFKLALLNLGWKKTMKVAVGAGRKLKRTDLTIVLSKPFIGNAPIDANKPVLIDTASASGQSALEAICVLSDFGDPIVAAERCLAWDGN